jgi:hypothetical protein
MRLTFGAVLVIGLCIRGAALGQIFEDERAQQVLISGRLTKSNGDPLPNAYVALDLAGANGSTAAMRTLDKGEFRFAARANRDYKLWLEASGFQVRSVQVKVREGDRDIELGDLKLIASRGASRSKTIKSGISPRLLKSIYKDLGLSSVDYCLQSNGLRIDQAFETTFLNLGTGRGDALLVEGRGICVSGASNGPMLLYARFGGAWRKVWEESGNRVSVLPTKTRGLFDVACWGHSSAVENIRLLYQFDGRRYVGVQCTVELFPMSEELGTAPTYEPCTWDWKH